MDLFNGLMGILNDALNYFFSFLPLSPFTSVINEIEEIPYLSYVTYFIPIDKILSVTLLWLGAIAVFYIYQIVLRWIKAIGD